MQRETLKALKRTQTGTGANYRTRVNQYIPGVLYGTSLDENVLLQISQRDVGVFLNNNYVGSTLTLDIEGEEHFALLKEIQIHPASRKVLHLDFQALKKGEEIKVSIPVVIEGAEKLRDFVCQTMLSEIEITCLPKYLVPNITLDVTGKQAGDQLMIKDLDLYKDENIKISNDPESVVYLISQAEVFTEPEPTEESEETQEDSQEATEE